MIEAEKEQNPENTDHTDEERWNINYNLLFGLVGAAWTIGGVLREEII